MTDPGQSLALSEWLSVLGFKAVTIVAAFFGATVALVSTPRLNLWQLIASILAGMAVAVYMEPLVSYWIGLPTNLQAGVAFILGLSGLIIAAGVIEVSRKLPAIALGWLDRKFGGGK